jgi:hypothetical protein
LSSDSYGACLIEGLTAMTHQDTETPPPGDGFGYLVQGNKTGCGLGSLGFTSWEEVRVNNDGAACAGH